VTTNPRWTRGVRVLLADDDRLFAEMLALSLAIDDRIEIVGQAANGAEAVELAELHRPDVVVMDVHMPIVDGVQATRRIVELLPGVRIVAHSSDDDATSIDAMTDAGASAYCIKGAPLWELERAIAGRSEAFVRFADSLAKATTRARIGTIVSREILALTGASAAAVYVASPGVPLFAAGVAGCVSEERLAAPPGIALRAYWDLKTVRADASELSDLEQIGVPCSSAMAIPLVSDGEALGSLFVSMPAHGGPIADEAFVSDIAALAASALAAERRLALIHAEGRCDVLTGIGNGRALGERLDEAPSAGAREPYTQLPPADARPARVLFVDDDSSLLMLLRTTFELIDIEIAEAQTAAAAVAAIAAYPPDVVVLDIGLPGVDGLELCRRLKEDPATRWIGIVLLTGAGAEAEAPARSAGADALMHKPFSPLELLAVVERLAGGLYEGPFVSASAGAPDEQLLLYANDLRRLLEIERGRQELLKRTNRQTVAALASVLESKDLDTATHAQRALHYAVELAEAIEPGLLHHPSVEYGFLLHDVGKIRIPNHVLQKNGPLDAAEQRLMRTHTVLGEQLLGDVDLLHGEGLRVVRCHHERWDGGGYPDGLVGREIPLAARIFALADALDAMTSDRPYRKARRWGDAAAEIRNERGRQFDPDVVDAFRGRELILRGIRRDLALA